ncbi:MAG TPA: hypothetical protein VFL91_26435 [Thermomicrobiales bacterium]|nr:hypothetical protein [Thermomicrobiales bacterium]
MSEAGRDRPVWPPFVLAAFAVALTAGFGAGAALFAASGLGTAAGRWWPAVAQVHGHCQLFGWAGLAVLGVGFHFLPRLRGAPLAHPGAPRAVLWLIVGGLVARMAAQPALAAGAPEPGVGGWQVLLVAGGLAELAGASVALALLWRTLRNGPPLGPRAGLRGVLPFLVAAFGGLWLALAVNVAGVWGAGGGVVDGRLDRLTVELAFYLFLVPVAVAMSARTFPLYFRTPPPAVAPLRAGLACLVAGLAARVTGELAGAAPVAALGRLGLAAALGCFVAALGVFAPARPVPRGALPLRRDPLRLHALSAYGWLVAAALLLLDNAATLIGAPAVSPDAERHALGAGFVTLLILGVAARMLPGFARRPLRAVALVWATLALGNLAALLRVVPLLLTLPAGARDAALAAAGVLDLLAILALAVNLAVWRGPWGVGRESVGA